MMIPTFEGDVKLYAIVGSGLFFALAFMYIGYSLNEQDPNVVCAPHIGRVAELTQQTKEIEMSISENRARYIKESRAREAMICADKVEEMRKRYTELRCKICKRTNP